MAADRVLERVPAGRRKVSVLLVDDQAIVGEGVRRMLQADHDVVFEFCQDGTQALERALATGPTVILLDLVMPGIEGLDVLDSLRRDERTRDIPVIVLSSTEEAHTKAEAFARGANDYIVKLPDPVELLARVRHHSQGYLAALERNDAYAALERSQRALAEELAQAAAYVRSLLPERLSGMIETEWRFLPSVQLGGDAFGYHWLDEGRLALYLLDVSGHGVRSALLSITAMNALRARTLPGVDFGDPAQVLAGLNAAFPMDQHDGMYFTIWYGVYDTASRGLTFGNAGHPPALLVSAGDESVCIDRLGDPGFFIGMLPEAVFETQHTTVPPHSNLFLFSDGAYEITRPDGSMWSLDALATLLLEHDPARGLDSLDRIERTIREVRSQAAFEDDVSLLEVRFGGES